AHSLLENARVNAFSLRSTVALVVATALPLAGSDAAPKPAVKGIKTIDQGGNDSRLKGYFTPEGIKVEIVAEEPVIVNPVGMTCGDDGTPYVLQWRSRLGE